MAEETIFIPGIDYSLLFGGFSSALNQGIALAVPVSYRGLVQYQESMPIVIGQPSGYPANWYEWQKQGVWVRPSDGRAFSYKNLVGFINIANLIDNDIIIGAMIQNNTIPLSKILVPPGTPATSIPVVNAGGTQLVYQLIINAIVDGTFPVSRLVPGANKTILRSLGGISQWVTLNKADINEMLGVGGLNPSNIDGSGGGPGFILVVDATSTFMKLVDPATLVGPNSIPLSAIQQSGATAGQVVTRNAGNTAWEPATIPTATTITKNPVTGTPAEFPVPAFGGQVVFSHGFSAIPSIVNVRLKCTANNSGYATNQYVDLPAFYITSGNNEGALFSVTVDATNVTVKRMNNTNPVGIIDGSTGSEVVLADFTKWVVAIDTIKIS